MTVIDNIKYVLKNIWEWERRLFICIIGKIPASIFLIGIELVMPAAIINTFENTNTAGWIAFVIIFFYSMKFILQWFNTFITAKEMTLEHKMTLHYLSILSAKTMELDYAMLENPDTKIQMEKANQASASNHTDAMQLPNHFSVLFVCVLKLVLFSAVISLLNPVLLLLLFITAGIQYVTLLYTASYEEKTKDKRTASARRIYYTSSISENLSAGKDIRLFGMKNWLAKLMSGFFKEHYALYNQLARRKGAAALINLLIILFRDGFSYYYIISHILKGNISIGEFVLYFTAISQFVNILGDIAASGEALFRGQYQIQDIRAFLSIKNYFQTEGGQTLANDKITIELIDVSYTYPNAEKPTLSHISLTIREDENIAVVGPNGAGKTTLVKLICGMYIPTEGSIRINGRSITEYNRSALYGLYSSVFQKFRFLPLSIASNIMISGTDKIRLWHSICSSGLEEKIKKLKLRENTPLMKEIHKDGTELSGGEGQKLMLARALYKDAAVYVLDEPAAALDPIAENRVYHQYQVFTKKRSSVFISHRLASTRFCDRIIYMENGRIIESGTHQELMKLNQKYADLFHIQSRYYKNTLKSEEAAG